MLTSIPRPEHPNPQWERKNWKNLNGQWQFEIDNGRSGEARGLIQAEALKSAITLPFCPESKLSGVGNTDFMNCVWYKKALEFTEGELAGNRVLFHIGASDFETKVWVNGESAGLPHFGGYSSFHYDITALLHPGSNLITIAAYDDVRSGAQACGKQAETYSSEGCHYTRTTGIWQTVWYEIVPESYISYAQFRTDAENATVTVLAELCGQGDLSAEVYYAGKPVGSARKSNLSVHGQLEIALSEKHLWELGNGRLYDMVLRFGEDEVKTYFGLRTIELRDGKFLLNGKSVFQRLILDQGFYPDGICTAPTEEALIEDIECGLKAGFNGARMHQKVFEPRYIYHADRLGYMVWGEYGSWGLDHSTLEAVAHFLPDWLDSVRRDLNHPAIIGWCPLNETWDYGPQKKRQNGQVLRIVYEQTKLLDPTRPCIDTSGNYHVVTDIFDVHWYEQNPEVFKAAYDRLFTENKLEDRHSDRQQWKGEPVFISEYGGIGFQLTSNAWGAGRTSTWSYGKTASTYEEFYARYEGLTTAILDNPKIMGLCYTQLTDVEQEKNGLYTYEGRKPKFDMEIIARINKKKAAIED